MYPSEFSYKRPKTLAEALSLIASDDGAVFMSGGMTLLPAMKHRLQEPSMLIDLRGIADLHGISVEGGVLTIGAATPHAEVASSDVVKSAIPALAALAGSIADPQVRNMGTIGGSIANNDPSADYPSAALGLGATIVTNARSIPADDFFTGMFSTALEPGEIVVKVAFPIPASAGYAKFRSQASRYAMAGSFVAKTGSGVRVAITGSGNDGVYRWSEAEAALTAALTETALDGITASPDDMMEDMHGDAAYRAALVTRMTRLAVANQGAAHIV